MTLRTTRSFRFAALVAAALLVLAVGQARADLVNSTINLGPANGGSIGNFTASVMLGSGSQLQLGASAISGNYKEHLVFVNTNLGFSAQNENANLSLSPSTVTLATNNASATASLDYDNITPPSPITLQSFNANLSDGAVAGLTINSSSIGLSTSIGTFQLTPTFSGSLSNLTFTSSGPADASAGSAVISGTYSAFINGSVTGSLNVLGANLSLGTLFTFPTNTVVSFAGSLPTNVNLSDTGQPFGADPTQTMKNNMLADFGASLGSLTIPFSFSAALATSENFNVSSGSSGITSIKIQNTNLVANITLSNVAFDMNGTVPNTLIPEPSTMVLGGIGLFGLVGIAVKRRKNA